jgi:hypothetical protein
MYARVFRNIRKNPRCQKIIVRHPRASGPLFSAVSGEVRRLGCANCSFGNVNYSWRSSGRLTERAGACYHDFQDDRGAVTMSTRRRRYSVNPGKG